MKAERLPKVKNSATSGYYRESTHLRMFTKENHPGYRVVFFVMDESSAYFELDSRNERIIEGEWSTGIPHLWYRDEVFVNAFVSSEIDYLIWYAPFKHCDAFSETDGTPFTPPSAVVYNIREFCAPLIKYDEERMDSTEA